MLDVEILPPAEDDFEQSYFWYRERSFDAAARFRTAIRQAIDKVRHDSKLGIRIDDNYRFYRLKKSFPFYLVYRTETTKIVIVAIAHNRREPGYWRTR
jgi:plasmid stabilization system protein ParE